MKTDHNLESSAEQTSKKHWSKPEIEILSTKTETLGVTAPGDDDLVGS